jgi:hypothetical protein
MGNSLSFSEITEIIAKVDQTAYVSIKLDTSNATTRSSRFLCNFNFNMDTHTAMIERRDREESRRLLLLELNLGLSLQHWMEEQR